MVVEETGIPGGGQRWLTALTPGAGGNSSDGSARISVTMPPQVGSAGIFPRGIRSEEMLLRLLPGAIPGGMSGFSKLRT